MTTPMIQEEKTMKDLLQLLRETVPLLESVRNSIQDSSSKIPKASAQLSKVTRATETAAVEILDVVEKMTNRICLGEKRLIVLKKSVEENREAAAEVLNQLKTMVSRQKDNQAIETLIQQLQSSEPNQNIITAFREVESIYTETKEDSMTISIALQVQDITNQQIVGVSNSIDSVYHQLADALKRFDKGVLEPVPRGVPAPETVVDINAEYTKSPERQSAADEIFNAWNQNQ